MILGVAAAFLAVAVSSLSALQKPTCLKETQYDYVEGRCPVNVTSTPLNNSNIYSENVSIHVWLKADDLRRSPKIKITGYLSMTIYPWEKRKGHPKKNFTKAGHWEIPVRCRTGEGHNEQWRLIHHITVKQNNVIWVLFNTSSTHCSVRYEVLGPIPAFDLEVNPLSKSFNVTLGAGNKSVYANWSYNKRSSRKPVTIIPSQSQSAVLDFPYLLPCVCVEVYYTNMDSRRHITCPFSNPSVLNATDVWSSSELTIYEARFTWSSPCAASVFNISASLCWRQHHHLCTSALGSSLEVERGRELLNYNTTQLDKHPLMCLQFSLQGSQHIYCPFKADMSSWEASLGSGRKSLVLYLTSSIPATFSAQLCVLNERACTPMGEIHSVTMTGNTTDAKMKVPIYVVAQEPCVQVWRSSPRLKGRRLFCPDYAHRRHGLYAVATVTLLCVTVFVIGFLHRLTKSGPTGWLCIQKPALLVCSSEQSAHISAVCALASILQGDLSATVHLALWALRSQTQDRAQAGVADLGPLPWLYGQWETVRKEQGKVLIIWSLEAKKTYEKWKEGEKNVKRTEMRHKDYSNSEVEHEKHQEEAVEYSKHKRKDRVQSCEGEREPCAVIAPVFMAALARLEGALQRRDSRGVAFVYFQGFCHNRDIPKAFRGIPRYCLPQDFRGLLQELGAMQRPLKTGKLGYRCLPRLLLKIMSVWLARRLAQKLQTLLPQTQGKKKPRVAPSQKQTLRKKQNRLKLPPTEDSSGRGTSEERESLHGSPTRGEQISSQVSRV